MVVITVLQLLQIHIIILKVRMPMNHVTRIIEYCELSVVRSGSTGTTSIFTHILIRKVYKNSNQQLLISTQWLQNFSRYEG